MNYINSHVLLLITSSHTNYYTINKKYYNLYKLILRRHTYRGVRITSKSHCCCHGPDFTSTSPRRSRVGSPTPQRRPLQALSPPLSPQMAHRRRSHRRCHHRQEASASSHRPPTPPLQCPACVSCCGWKPLLIGRSEWVVDAKRTTPSVYIASAISQFQEAPRSWRATLQIHSSNGLMTSACLLLRWVTDKRVN
jgi:hypothetical protein